MSMVVPTYSGTMNSAQPGSVPDAAVSPTSGVILYPEHLPERVQFDNNRGVLTSSIPHHIMMTRNVLIR